MSWCGFIVIALRGPDYDTRVHFLRALYVTGCLLLAGRAHLVPHSPAQGGEGIERKVPGRGQVAKRYGGEAINCRPGPLSNLADFRDDHPGIPTQDSVRTTAENMFCFATSGSMATAGGISSGVTA